MIQTFRIILFHYNSYNIKIQKIVNLIILKYLRKYEKRWSIQLMIKYLIKLKN